MRSQTGLRYAKDSSNRPGDARRLRRRSELRARSFADQKNSHVRMPAAIFTNGKLLRQVFATLLETSNPAKRISRKDAKEAKAQRIYSEHQIAEASNYHNLLFCGWRLHLCLGR